MNKCNFSLGDRVLVPTCFNKLGWSVAATQMTFPDPPDTSLPLITAYIIGKNASHPTYDIMFHSDFRLQGKAEIKYIQGYLEKHYTFSNGTSIKTKIEKEKSISKEKYWLFYHTDQIIRHFDKKIGCPGCYCSQCYEEIING